MDWILKNLIKVSFLMAAWDSSNAEYFVTGVFKNDNQSFYLTIF